MPNVCPLRMAALDDSREHTVPWATCLESRCAWWTHDAGCAVTVLAAATVRQTMAQQRTAGEL